MKLPSYLSLSRHYVFRFRRRVPDDLLDRFQCNELRCTLGTKDKNVAVRAARMLAIRTDLFFDRLRRKMGTDKDDDLISSELIWHADLTEFGLGDRKIEYDANNPADKEAAERLIAQYDSLQRTQTTRPATTPYVTSPTLSELVDVFLSISETQRRRDKAATTRKDKDALSLFQQVVGGNSPIKQVSQVHANKFAEFLETRGLAPNTKNNHMGAVSKFSKWVNGRHPEAEHNKLDFSTLRFKAEKRADKQRDAFTVEEVKSILGDQRLNAFKTLEPHKYWLPYIAAYSGMRVEEIAQLDPMNDFVLDDVGVYLFDVNENNEKQLKNKPSARQIPIHQALINLGLLDYVNALKEKQATRLFPDLKIAEGRLGKNGSKAVNRFIRSQIGVSKSLHSFRHTVTTLLKQQLVDVSLAAAVLGHAHGGITYSRYGKNHSSVVLRDKAIAKITYGLECESPAPK